ncbi:class I tRNA ligase family protein [Candidatus Parcubacteria bacterium]|nr:class I tRNA ligase family protein [Candidatus Parcubacteria bacterium]
MTITEMAKAYEPKQHEKDIYRLWEESGLFNPDNLKGKGKPFTISMPPPNATGILHLGHAAALSYEDLMIRYKRLQGYKTLWLPGTDHAAIATQTKVEKILAEEGTDRETLGREKFLQRVREYVTQSQGNIKNQTRRMGSSCDWSRERYTFDEGLSQAVNEAFVRMYEDELVYRGHRIVNWCTRCASTLADDEVEYQEQDAKLYYIKYGPFIVATTRPETKLADTGVAVHPEDERYQKYVGQELDIDLAGHKIKVKVFADKEVDKDFGSGVVGVTPAHSAADYNFAQRHNLQTIKLIDEQGQVMESGGKYKGIAVLDARKAFVKDLEQAGQIDKIEEIKNNLSICYRCETAIEPLTSEQWFVAVDKEIPGRGKTLKQLASETVKNKEIEIVPERFVKTYHNWMDNLHDWCISRQIWWGHRIPVWYKKNKTGIKITFFRHTQSEANALKIGAGHKDYKLTAKGVVQAQEIAKEINPDDFDVIFSSDLSRAKDTASILFPGKKVIEDNRLREVDFGDLTDKSGSLIDKHRVKGFPNGETYQQVRDRVQLFFDEVANKYKNKRIAIVAHSGTWKTFEIILNGGDFSEDSLNVHAPLGAHQYNLDQKQNEIHVGLEKPTGSGWVQDPDTLDTWFSSSLWTFSTLGWPEKTKDFKKFHPTTVMETGYDIIFFWVARMILMTEYLLEDKPFETVYLHGMIRDKDGRKMSKSLGNGIDPIDMIDKFGTDALRLSLIIGSALGADLRVYEEKIAGYRNFVNKLWNISRFILTSVSEVKTIKKQPKVKTLADKWILSEFNEMIDEVSKDLDNFKFSSAGEKLYHFTWDDLADWYLEIAKIEKDKDEILLYILERLLIICHPFTPFVTENIWKYFDKENLLMVADWPKVGKVDKDTIINFAELKELVVNLRNLKAANKIPPTDFPDCNLVSAILSDDYLQLAAKMARVNLIDEAVDVEPIYVNSSKVLIDLSREMSDKEKNDIEKYIKSLEIKLANEKFTSSAPPEVVAETKRRLEQARNKLK